MSEDRLDSVRDVETLIAARAPETDILEFKEKIENRQVARALAAMANHRGGQVLFGVREQNSRAAGIVPIELSEAAERVASIARDLIDEALLLAEAVPLYVQGDNGVLAVRVPASPRAPHFVNGQAFVRSGPTTRAMTAHEIGALFVRRGEAFLREFAVAVRRPADLAARIDSERRPRGVNNRGRIKESVHHRFVLVNRGEMDARNVYFRLLSSEGEDTRIPEVMIDDHPIERIRGGTEIGFPASVTMGPGRASLVEITWEDDDGASHAITQSLSV